MKITFLVLCLIIACAFAYTKIEHSNGADVLNELEAGNHNVYILMFYHGDRKGSQIAQKNKDYEDALINGVLERYPGFRYTAINADDGRYSDLVRACGVVTEELRNSPSVLIMENGNGAWIHGPQTMNKIAEFAPVYSQRSNQ